jgi:hypothetical protein
MAVPGRMRLLAERNKSSRELTAGPTMISTLTLGQIAAQLRGRLDPLFPHNDADPLRRLSWPRSVARLLDALAVEPSLLRRTLEDLFAGFTQYRSELARGYHSCNLSLPVLAKGFLRFLAETGPA